LNVGFFKNRLFRLTPTRIIVLGFLALIILGAFLLFLPISAADNCFTKFTDSLFTAVSAVCVTGLAVVDTNTHWSVFGKIIILLLIQIGALGVMSVAALFSIVTGKQISLKQRIAIQESISHFTLSDIVSVFKKILIITLIVEALGAVIIAITLVPMYGWVSGIGKSIFHSISSFCNAGFDLFGSNNAMFVSLSNFGENSMFVITTAFLIIIGGLGYIVWWDILSNKRILKYTLHTKIVLITTSLLLILGTLGYLFLEYNASMKSMTIGQKVLDSFFHSVTARTAGFNIVQMDQMSEAGSLLTVILMFIGGAPGSTAGGIKVTTIFILIMTVVTFARGRNELHLFKRNVPDKTITRAISIFIIGLLFVILSTGILLINGEGRFLSALIESTSAFGTVGLSTGITPGLCDFSKYQLMVTMLVGRIGTITAIATFTSMQAGNQKNYKYTDGKIIVG
jgi:trk system potassium uptake protein TrkH